MKGCGRGIRRGWLSSQISASHNILLQSFDIVDSVLSSCVTQLELYTKDKLSSTIFCCLSVCE